jgi:uncharacterized FAD-dependent dehydrogenase
MKVKENALEYFKLFEEGNDIGLSEIYDEKIVLIDWNGKWESKSEVIKMNQELFEGSKISVNVEDIQVGMSPAGFPSDRVYCKIHIQVNDVNLKVMDVIDFNEEGKIIKIEAYKG